MAHLPATEARQKRDRQRLFDQLVATLLNKFKWLRKKVSQTRRNARHKHTLSRLNDHQLKDIGLTRDKLHSGAGRSNLNLPAAGYADIGFQPDRLGGPKHPDIHRLPED